MRAILFCLLQNLVESVKNRVSKLAELSDFGSVLWRHEAARADELEEHTDKIPREDEHQREGEQVSQCPPVAHEYPQQCARQQVAEGHRYKDTYAYIEAAVEHLILNQLAEEYLWDDKKQQRRRCRD